MTTVGISLALLICSVQVSMYLKTRLTVALVIVLDAWILISYLGTHMFNFSTVFVTLMGITILSIVGIFNAFKSKNPSLDPKTLYEMAFYLILISSIAWTIGPKFFFTHWDEFSAWGTNLKIFLIENNFATLESPHAFIESGRFLSYPPSTMLSEAIFAYGGDFQENRAVFGLALFSILHLFAAIEIGLQPRISYRKWIMFLFLPVPYLFGYQLNNLYADFALAVCFLLLFNTINSESLDEKVRKIIFAVAGSVFILIKPIAPSLYLILLSSFMIKTYFESKLNVRVALIQARRYSLVFALPILTWLSWFTYVQFLNLESKSSSFAEIGSVSQGTKIVIDAYISQMSASLPVVPSSMTNFLSTYGIAITLNTWQFVSILLISNILFLRISKRPLSSYWAPIAYLIAFVIYEATLVFSYVFIFSSYEATYVASLNRYNATFLIAWLLWFLIGVFNFVSRTRLRSLLAGLPLVTIMLALVPFSYKEDLSNFNGFSTNPIFAYQQENNQAILLRNKAEELFSRLATLEKNGRIYFISQNSTGFEKYMFNYIALPSESNYRCWSVGEKYYEGDVWTCNQSLETLIEGYSYLAVFKADEIFWRTNSKFLSQESRAKTFGVYSITQVENEIKLVEVANTPSNYLEKIWAKK